MTSPEWLERVYTLVGANQTDKAIDVLFSHMDSLFLDGNFEDGNAILLLIDTARLNLDLLVAVLSITLSCSDKLPNRKHFFARAEREMKRLAPERVNKILEGLR